MRSALTNRPINDFQKPETVITTTIDPSTGYLATPECPDKKEEFFVIGTEPKEYCPLHGGDLLNQGNVGLHDYNKYINDSTHRQQ